MNSNLAQLVSALAGRDVLVLGEAMLDSYLEGTTGRFCPEAPVPIVSLGARLDLPGGAANTAVNAHALGGRVTFLSAVGADPEAGLLRGALEARGVPAEPLIAVAGRRTLTKQRVVAAGQLLLRIDQGTTDPVGGATEQALIDRLADAYPRCDAVIVSDYGYGIVTPAVLRALADLQARWSRALVIDARRLDRYRGAGATAVKPNYAEAARLLGAGALDGFRDRADGIARHGDRLLERTGAQIVAVTLDCEGAVVFERGRAPYRTYARAVRSGCVAGAGDTYTAALALALAAGAPTAAAAELAAAAAAVVVGKERTATCTAQELREQVLAEGKFFADRARLAACVEAHRRQGRRVVFTNGCFDILHRGHITYLNRAKALGDVLVVGVNSDDSIRRLKGPSRPINTLDDRIQVLAALSCIDHLVAFDEDTPCNLVGVVRPDVFVKGGDYTRDRLPEAAVVEAYGGRVQILPYLADRSTTGIIERIQGGPARPAAAAAGS
jgi:D-beta-D-heptose 7-phosphate kinase/D-beta-D-heptose 1-phosphate adenosyltransferase